VAIVALALLTVSVADAQSLVRRDVHRAHFKRVPQPDVDRYVPMAADRDAFLVVRVKIGADGIVQESTPLDGFYGPEQAEGAKRLGMRLVFEPTIVDGMPQESTGAVPVRSIRPYSARPMSPVLKSLLQDTTGLIGRQDWAGALANLDALQVSHVRGIPDYCAVEALRAVAYEGSGKLLEALHHANEATRASSGKVGTGSVQYQQTDKGLIIQALETRARILKSLSMYGEALDTLTELQLLQKKSKAAGLEEEAASLRSLIAGIAAISIPIRIDAYGKSTVKLIRPVFSVAGLPPGAVTQAWVMCGPLGAWPVDMTYYEVPLTLNKWSRPETVDHCRIEFTGQTGTTFELIQQR
jgi:hypothetical protein